MSYTAVSYAAATAGAIAGACSAINLINFSNCQSQAEPSYLMQALSILNRDDAGTNFGSSLYSGLWQGTVSVILFSVAASYACKALKNCCCRCC